MAYETERQMRIDLILASLDFYSCPTHEPVTEVARFVTLPSPAPPPTTPTPNPGSKRKSRKE